jgi:hypothetical protein
MPVIASPTAREGVVEGLSARDVSFLPIVSAYVRELGTADEINRVCPRSK